MDPSINPSIKSAHVKLRVNILCKDTSGFFFFPSTFITRSGHKSPKNSQKHNETIVKRFVKVDITLEFIDVM